MKENEWEISSHKLPHLESGWVKEEDEKKSIFNINAHIYKGFNKWIKFICARTERLARRKRVWWKANLFIWLTVFFRIFVLEKVE